MKSHRLFFAPVLGAALVAAAWMAPVHALQVPKLLDGSPEDGVVCRAGYTGTMQGNAFVCSKTGGNIQVDGECLNANRPNYITRSLSSDPNDVCVNDANKKLGPTDPIGSIKFDLPTASASKITTKVGNKQHDEAVALGLSDKDVEVGTGSPKLNANASGKDSFDVPLTFFTRPVPNGGLIASPFSLAK